MSTIDQKELAEKLTSIKMKLLDEAESRAKLKYTPEYQSLAKQIEELTAQQDALLSSVPDSTAEYESLKQAAVDYMKTNNLDSFENLSAKFREKKEVNRMKALEALNGDLDMYFTISSITQVALKNFAKSNPQYKTALLDSIEVVDREITDVVIAG